MRPIWRCMGRDASQKSTIWIWKRLVGARTARGDGQRLLQSVSNPAVYAAGDAAASGPPLTPTAAHEGEVVAANLLHGNHRRPNYAGLASVAFTVPALATVGLTEEAARTQGRRFQTQYQDTPRSGLRRVGPGRPRRATRS